MREAPVFVAVLALAAGALAAGLSATAAAPGQGGQSDLEVYVGELAPDQVQKLAALGLDHEDVATGEAGNGKVRVEAVITGLQAEKLRGDGVDLAVKKVKGKRPPRRLPGSPAPATPSTARTARPAASATS